MNKIQFLTMPGCHNCAAAKKIFDEIMPGFPNAEVEEVDMTTPEGQELVQKYNILSSPGILVNDEFFAFGGATEEQFRKKFDELKVEK